MKGRATVAFTRSTERPLSERSEDMTLSDRERGEGFPFSFMSFGFVTASEGFRGSDGIPSSRDQSVGAVIQCG